MKKILQFLCLSLILCISSFSNKSYSQCPYEIDQEQNSSNIGVYGTNQWQSFKAGNSGRVGSIDFYSNAAYEFNGSIVLQLRAGTGTNGSLLYSNSYYFDTIPSGWVVLEIPWDDNITLSNNSTYTLRLSTGNNLYTRVNNGDVYTDGHYYSNVYGTNSGWDLMFRTTWGNPVTVEYTLLGETEYCEVGPGANMYMSDTKNNILYKLYRDGNYVQKITGTGSSVSFSNQNTEGHYTVIAKDTLTGCTHDMLGSIDLVEVPIPIVDAGLDDTLCGYQYSLQGTAENYSSLMWTTTGSGTFTNNGTLTPTYNASDADLMTRWLTFYLTAQPNNPCSDPVVDDMQLLVFERAEAGTDDTICKGEDFLLNGNYYGDVPVHDTFCVANCEMPQYCLSSSINAWYISYYNIEIDDSSIIQTNINYLNYLDYTNFVYKTLYRDSTFKLKVFVDDYNSILSQISAFIDWNRDGDFEDEDEIIGDNSFSNQNDIYTSYILVPPEAVLGNTNLRIIITSDLSINQCGTYYIGQTVDIKINIRDRVPNYHIWYDWTGPNNFSSIEKRPILENVSIYESGTYHLEMSNEFGCSSSDDIELTILPKDTLSRDTSICYGESVTLEVTGPQADMATYGFLWSNSATTTSIVVTPPVTTTYYVTVTGSICTTVDSVKVTVNPLPVVDLGNDTSLCRYTLIEIDSNYVSYDWNNGFADTYSFVLDTTGSYTVVVVDTNNCTNSSNTVLLTVLETPASFTGLEDNYLTNAPQVSLTGNPSGGTFTGDGMSGNIFTPVNAGIGFHDITYTYIDATPCSNSETQSVQVYVTDMSMASMLSPQTGFLSSNEIVSVQLKNNSLNAVNSMLVSFHSESSDNPPQIIDISEIVSESVDPGDTLTYVFQQTVNMSTADEYSCTISVTTPGDEIECNDSLDVFITNYVGSNCYNPYEYTFTANSIPTINHSISSTNWYLFTLDSAYINFQFALTPNLAWNNMDVDIWETCNMNNEVIPTSSSFLANSITLNFDTIWPGVYYVRVTGDGDYSFDVTGNNGIYGCTNPNSPSYNPLADFDDGSCQDIFYDCGTGPPPTYLPIPAQISSDITWNTDAVLINCDVDILDGVTVTVAPGTVVQFSGQSTINVKGTFIAIGNNSDSIVFTGNNSFDGCHFVFDNGPYPGSAGAMSDNDTSRFEYCKFYDNRVDNSMIRINNFSKLVFNNNFFYKNSFQSNPSTIEGMFLCENSSDIKISNNIISKNLLQYMALTSGLISCDDSNPLITNNTITANSIQSDMGGAILCTNNSYPDITSNYITGNVFLGNADGGITCLNGSNPDVSLNLVMENIYFTLLKGGGILNIQASGTFYKNIISHNWSFNSGGFYCSASNAILEDNIIQFNFGYFGGGIGIYDLSHLTVRNCLIHANRSFYDSNEPNSGTGGGIRVENSEIDLFNNIISYNDGLGGGGISASNTSQINCTNNTISGNYSFIGGAVILDSANASFTNTIMYYNNSQIGGQILNLSSVPIQIDLLNCNIEDGQNGITDLDVLHTGIYTNNIDIAPYFVDEESFNFELQFQSACINGGTPDTTGLGIPQYDITGKQRIINDTIDIGAVETTQIGTCGNITENTVWDADTICVACDIMVKDSATLTINPGTVVEFLGSYKLNIQGNLVAEGTPTDSITFTVADTTGFSDYEKIDGGWQGIHFDNGPLGAYGDMNDNDSSIISYCNINYGKVVNNYIDGFSNLLEEIVVPNGISNDTLELGTLLNIDTLFDKGGAIYVNNVAKLKISNSLISNNKAYAGGSIYCENNASPEISNTKICNNEAKTFGGGLFLTASSPKIKNSLICNNSAIEQSGGGISCYYSMPELTNLTVSNNYGLYQSGLVFIGSTPIIKNSIFWGNSSIDSDYPVIQIDSIQTDTILVDTITNITYSNIQGYSGGLGNISSLPYFNSPSLGIGSQFNGLSADWSLNGESNCINAGTPDTSNLDIPITDLGDNDRIQNDTIDIGAYETLRIPGCTNPIGINFNPAANYDDGSCEFSGEDCWQAINYGTVNDPAISGVLLPNLDKWAYFTINTNYKYVTVSLCGSNFDTQLEVYEDCDSINYIAYNDNSCGMRSELTIDSLSSGTYYVRLLGIGNSNGAYELEITGTEMLNATLAATHISCFGYSDGEINMTITGGTPPYTIDWSNGMTTEDLLNVVAGTYTVTITDTENTSYINATTLVQPDAPTRTYNIKNIVCYGDSTGEINLSISGANAPYTFEWTGGATSEDITQLIAGSYIVTITGDDGCIINDTTVVSQNNLIVPTFDIEHVSCFGESDGDIDLSVTGGISPYSYEWTFSFDTTFAETTEDLHILAYGTYSLTITDDSACQVNDIAVVYEPDLLELSITGTNVSIFGASDGISDLEVTGGVQPYSYLWSNDSTSQDLTGIPEGTYYVTVTDDHSCNATGSIYISEPLSTITQSINLPQDWSIFSTYIIPDNPDISDVLSNIVDSVIIAKDGNGQVYYPAYGTNQINDLTIGAGYYIKMLNPETLDIEGTSVIPENTHLTVNQGWSILGYLRHPPGPIADMLSDITSEIVIVKSGSGMIYWPDYYVNTIGSMTPGEGYKIKMKSTQTLTYPSNNYSSAKIRSTTPIPGFYLVNKNSDNNMTLCIPVDAWNILPEIGDEIGVFNNYGDLFGSCVYTGNNSALTIWGNDELSFATNGFHEGDELIINLWHKASNSTEILTVTDWIEGDEYYSNNKISIVKSINQTSAINQQSSAILYQNIPNPFSKETEIRFYLPNDTNAEIQIYNVFGELIETIVSQKFSAGMHSIIFNPKNYASGNYYYKIITKGYVATKNMNIIKY